MKMERHASAEQAMQAAATALHDGDGTKAESLCAEVLARDARHPQALLMLGLIEQQRQRYVEARALLERAVEAQPGSADAHALLGQVLRDLGEDEAALAAWDRALALQPERGDLLFNRGNLLRDLGRVEAAISSYDEALAHSGDDAVVLNNRAVALQELGRHEEALDSLARALSLVPDDADALSNRGIALQAVGRHALALECFDAVLALRPGDPAGLLHRSNALQALGRLEEALASCDEAVRAVPQDAGAQQRRAALLLELGRPAEALASCEQALALQPGLVAGLTTRGLALQALGGYEQALQSHRLAQLQQATPEGALGMGDALQALGRPQEALSCYEQALSLRPGYYEAVNNRGNALQSLNRHQEALASYEQARAMRPHDPEAQWNEGLALLALGELQRGWQKYEWRWQHRKLALPPRGEPATLWNGEPDIAGRTMLLYPEQGFGDAIQFVRYASRVAALGARVHLACHESLAELFGTVPGVARVLGADAESVPFDLHAPLMSLPLAFDTALETIPADVPYLAAAPAEAQEWRQRLVRLPGRRRVGLAWSGNPAFAGARAKACPVEQLLPLLGAADTAWVSLQTGAAAADIRALVGVGRTLVDCSEHLTSFARTAAVIESLDLVITIDTAVAHLAGALGKPVWVLLPFSADWRWLVGRADSPWYPTARLFRQPRIGDWAAVIAAVRQELDATAA
jgi:tetratricopeptide (TPR) repeat protein